MDDKSFISVPPNLENSDNLKRVLNQIIVKIDALYGNRGNEKPYTNNPKQGSISQLNSTATNEEIINKINELITCLEQANIIS